MCTRHVTFHMGQSEVAFLIVHAGHRCGKQQTTALFSYLVSAANRHARTEVARNVHLIHLYIKRMPHLRTSYRIHGECHSPRAIHSAPLPSCWLSQISPPFWLEQAAPSAVLEQIRAAWRMHSRDVVTETLGTISLTMSGRTQCTSMGNFTASSPKIKKCARYFCTCILYTYCII